jgi:hypothetical protein
VALFSTVAATATKEERTQTMDLTDEQLEVACDAWICAQHGRGLVVDIDHFVAAHELCEHGWLERRFHGDEMAYWWTRNAEMALDVNALMDSGVRGREN